MADNKEYWLIAYSQLENGIQTRIVNKVINVHPANWLQKRCHIPLIHTVLHFSIKINRNHFDKLKDEL